VKALSGAICEWAASQFSLTVMSQQGLWGLTNHSSPVTAVSGDISEWSATQFSMMFSESTGAVRAEDSFVISGNRFCDDLSGQRLSFP
jgi:hypothetical protein